jgi:hypothetical protein
MNIPEKRPKRSGKSHILSLTFPKGQLILPARISLDCGRTSTDAAARPSRLPTAFPQYGNPAYENTAD